MARPKKQEQAKTVGKYTVEQGENGSWLVRIDGTPARVFPSEGAAKKYIDHMVKRGK